jgi:hypothetical protein
MLGLGMTRLRYIFNIVAVFVLCVLCVMTGAADLQAGDRLLNDDGTWAEVIGVEIEAEPLTAFNLTVAEFHTYFVAANENASPVWVHNDCWDAHFSSRNGDRFDTQTPGANNGGNGSANGNNGGAGNGGGGGERLLWGSWNDYPHVTRTGPNGPQEYAVIGDRLYSQHAVARMQPSGQRYPSGPPVEGQPNLVGRDQTPRYINQPGINNWDGTQNIRGRSISPNYVEDVIQSSTPVPQPNGNLSYTSGDVEVITSNEGRVVTIITGGN